MVVPVPTSCEVQVIKKLPVTGQQLAADQIAISYSLACCATVGGTNYYQFSGE